MRLHVSTNTVKTQAHAVYRKLEVSSRSGAVARAVEIGLLDGRAPSACGSARELLAGSGGVARVCLYVCRPPTLLGRCIA